MWIDDIPRNSLDADPDRFVFDADTGEPLLMEVDIYQNGSTTEEILDSPTDHRLRQREINLRWRDEHPNEDRGR